MHLLKELWRNGQKHSKLNDHVWRTQKRATYIFIETYFSKCTYSRVWNKHTGTLINFWFLKFFLRLFNFLFLWLCTKDSNYLLFKRGLRLFKGLCLLFLPNVPGATFIQGGTLIPDSRVVSQLSMQGPASILDLRK